MSTIYLTCSSYHMKTKYKSLKLILLKKNLPAIRMSTMPELLLFMLTTQTKYRITSQPPTYLNTGCYSPLLQYNKYLRLNNYGLLQKNCLLHRHYKQLSPFDQKS